MKNIKIILVMVLLALSIHADDYAHTTAPTATAESFDASNWTPGSNVESIEEGSVENVIYGIQTGVQINNVLGKYYNRESSEIWGDYEYGLYTKSNSVDPFSFLTIENYGNISSDYTNGVAMVGLNGQLNNHATGYIFGGSVGVIIDDETGESLFNGFSIQNDGIITGHGTGIYKLNTNKSLYINNTGAIEADNYGIINRGVINIVNSGTIASFNNAAIYLLNGGTIDNTGTIRSIDDRTTGLVYPNYSILSGNFLTLKGNGNYIGNIKYSGTAEDLSLKSYLTLDNTHTNFKNSRLENWGGIRVDGGENYFNVEYQELPYRAEVYLKNGAILHTGDGITNGTSADANFYVDHGILNPYENSYDVMTFYWDRYAQQSSNGPKYYDKKEFEKLTVNNLTVSSQGGIVADFRISMPYYSDEPFWRPDIDIKSEGHRDPTGEYAGYGYDGWILITNPGNITATQHYQRMNYDKIDVKGTSYIADGATLYIVDHTYETPEENIFTGQYNYKIDLFDGDISFDDFTNIEFYSSTVGIDHFDNETGMVHLRLDKFDTSGKNIVDWWVKQTSLGFADIPQPKFPATATAMMMSVETQSGALEKVATSSAKVLPYELKKDYSTNIDKLRPSEELRETIYGFQSWNDIDAFMDTVNKLEYASLATSNLNLISNRVNQMFDRLGANHMRDSNGLNIWADVYFSNDSLDGTGNHGINGHGTEFAVGLDKMFNNKTFGLSMTYTDYTSTVNDDGVHTDIKSEGLGLNLYMMMDQGNLRHKAMLGYASYNNTGDDTQDFDSSEMFASYQAEWTFKTDSLEIKPFAGLRYSFVQFDEMREDAENGLKSFDEDSLESELGVKLHKQFKKLCVSFSGAWMHEFLDSQTTAEAFTSFGNFSQDGIARDTDSFRATIGFEYQLSDKVTLDFDYAKEMSDNSESDSVNGKITFRF